MQTYSSEEKAEAKRALPEKLSAFMDSPDLVKTYSDIEKKFSLNLGQMGALIEVVDLTLLGLEPQTHFPESAKLALRDLPNERFEGIVENVNEQIFAEAKRRLQGDSSEK